MPIGRPDWYSAGKSENLDTMNDLAELAVRLGSPIVFDRSGKTLFYDVFNRLDGTYTFTEVGVTTGHALDSVYARYGSNSIKTIIGVGVSNYVDMQLLTRVWQAQYLGFEIGVLSLQQPQQFTLTTTLFLDGTRYIGAIDCRNLIKDFYFYSSGSGYVLFKSESSANYSVSKYNVFRLLIDVVNQNYVAFSLNERTYGLSDYALNSVATGSSNALKFNATCYGSSGGALTVHYDHIIISEDR